MTLQSYISSRKQSIFKEKILLKEEISTKRYQNVEEMHSKRKMSMKWPQNMEEIQPKRKMSMK